MFPAVAEYSVMHRFEQGKSYFWLFPSYAFVFAMGFVIAFWLGDIRWGIVATPVALAYVVASEWWSGVAIDSWGNANYLRGSWQYRALVMWHGFAVVAFAVFSYFLIRGF